MPLPDPTHPVTILGAGLVGICTALSLLERGFSVRIIDRDAPGQATSMGNAGVISPWSIIPQSTPGLWKSIPSLLFRKGGPLSVRARAWPAMVPWGLRFLRLGSEAQTRATADAMALLCSPSIDLYRKHLAGTGQDHLVQDSAYVHAFRNADHASLEDLGYRIRREKGARLEIVGPDGLRALEPALSSEFQAAIVIYDQARALAPGRIGTALAEKAKRLGAVFVRDDISGLARHGETWQVTGAQGVYEAQTLVMCLGAWSGSMLRGVGIKVPLMAERGYHVEYPMPGLDVNNSVMDVDAKVVASSMETGLRVAGQAEFGPVDAPPDAGRQVALENVARAMFPDLPGGETRFWMGRRPSFPDSLPMLGHMPGHPGLYMNFGHSHYGLMMAPKSGDLLASILAGLVPNVDLTPFRADRFGV